MRRHRRLALVLPGVALMAVAGCGASTPKATPGATPVTGPQSVTLTTTDGFQFTPAVVHAHRGTVRFTIVNSGSYPHNLSFPGLGKTSATVSGNLGQQRTTFTVTFGSAGHFRFVCTYHSTAGMTGEVVVS